MQILVIEGQVNYSAQSKSVLNDVLVANPHSFSALVSILFQVEIYHSPSTLLWVRTQHILTSS